MNYKNTEQLTTYEVYGANRELKQWQRQRQCRKTAGLISKNNRSMLWRDRRDEQGRAPIVTNPLG